MEKNEWKKCKDLQKATKAKRKKIEEFQSDTDEEDDKIVEEEIEKEEEESDEEENTDGNKGEPIHFEQERENLQLSTEFLAMELCWKILCPPNKEEIVGKWFACIYDSKKSLNLYIERACKRFFDDKGGLPTYLEMDCLEQKTGVSESILKQGRSDKDMFPIKNISLPVY